MADEAGPDESRTLTSHEVAAVSDWLTEQGLAAAGCRIADVEPVGGGTQNVMVRFTIADRSLVLRRGPRHLRPASNLSILREGTVLTALAGTAVPHPRVVARCEDPSVLGDAVFYVMEPVDGFNASVELPTLHASDVAVRHDMGLQMVDALACLGGVDHLQVGLGDFGRPEGFLERQVGRWLRELDHYADYDNYPGFQHEGLTQLPPWLEANRPQCWTPGIMHGDFHAANVMFRRDSSAIAAIVDWEMCTIGDPLLDLGWLLATWQLPDVGGIFGTGLMATDSLATTAELAERYASRSERDLASLPWYVVLACFKLGILLEGTFARSCAGLAPREVGDELHQTTVRLFERAISLTEGAS